MKSFVIRWSSRLGALALFLAGVEVMARLDDYIHLGVPLLASPDNERDLKLRDTWGFRGRPHGLFRKWKLNEFGFRGPEISQQPSAGTTRILVLGASETLGLLESQGHEYPARLQQLLQNQGNFEVVNGGVTSLTAASMSSYWEHWASRFRPQIVLIYASPVFYLRDAAPPPLPVLKESECHRDEPAFQWRIVDRATSLYRTLPSWVRRSRRDIQLRREIASHDPDWFFTAVPEDRLDKYSRDVAILVRKIRQDGALPILVTHAISAASPPGTLDMVQLQDMRAEFCRPTAEVITQFEQRANQSLRDLARREGIPLIDAGAVLTGSRELFGDLVHFNDRGAEQMAEILAAGIASQSKVRVPRTLSGASVAPSRTTGPTRSSHALTDL